MASSLTSLCFLKEGVPGARERLDSRDGMLFDVIEIGNGSLTIVENADVDQVAYHSSDFVTWHERLKKALRDIRRGVRAPPLEWWLGRWYHQDARPPSGSSSRRHGR